VLYVVHLCVHVYFHEQRFIYLLVSVCDLVIIHIYVLYMSGAVRLSDMLMYIDFSFFSFSFLNNFFSIHVRLILSKFYDKLKNWFIVNKSYITD